ncbi:SOS response-associated peptidase family protein [Sphingomonas jaspsi]|uniref:SOS response-associated peptidase family protein n=1 Tax=Sphingomonas jaspsi TaxID=392409 RepID=UPI00316AE161
MEWGPAYSMVMTEACAQVAGVHDRMPVILRHETWPDWLDSPPDDARLLCQPYPADVTIRQTANPRVRR